MPEYPKDQIEFLQAVLEMRDAQDRYFKNRNNVCLRMAKARETKVDNLLTPFVKAGVIQRRNTTDNPRDTLF